MGERVSCPTCSRDDFASQHGMRIHHANVHGESLVEHVTKTCEICGAEYSVVDHYADRRTTCGDPVCSTEANRRSVSGSNHGMWRGGKVTVECVICGAERDLYPSDAEKTVTCGGDACTREAKRRALSGENHYAWGGGKTAEINCAVCETPYAVYPCYADRRRLCDDPECFAEFCSETNKGERNPMWAGGGVDYYGPNWPDQRRKALERDGYKCRICGMTDATHRDRCGKGLHVHHIIRFTTFGVEQYERANRLGNLVTMCIPHHNQWEGVPVVPCID